MCLCRVINSTVLKVIQKYVLFCLQTMTGWVLTSHLPYQIDAKCQTPTTHPKRFITRLVFHSNRRLSRSLGATDTVCYRYRTTKTVASRCSDWRE
jgi:hypothetical protein